MYSHSLHKANCLNCGFDNPGEFRYCGRCGARIVQATSACVAEPIAPQPSQPERRQLTVLFCDLVGSTSLSTRLDPEDFREDILLYHQACTRGIERFGGMVARYMGDGLLAYFGYPTAQEEAAERAVLAGLHIVAAVNALPAVRSEDHRPPAVRIGIATGIVVIGDRIGEGPAQEIMVTGEAPNLAARLQALAAPNTVVIAPATRRLLGDRFHFADLGTHDLRGFAVPVNPWQVIAPRVTASRFDAMQTWRGTPLVGRESHLKWLSRLWQSACDSHGKVALLSGDAGIGKSRLVQGLRDQLAPRSYSAFCFQCSPHYVNTALHPVIEHIQLAAGFTHEDVDDRKLAKLARWLGNDADLVEDLPLLASLLSIPPGEYGAPTAMSPQRQKERTFEVLLGRMRRIAEARPVLVVVEDVHWVDPTTQEFLSVLIDRLKELRVLLIITFRSEFVAPWRARSHVERRKLNRLPARKALELAANVAGAGFPSEIIKDVVAKTDRVPLYIEEVTRAVLATRADQGQGATADFAATPLRAIPSTLHDSLMARLDQLGTAKLIAQVAGAIGREFSYDLLEAVMSLPSAALRDGLRALERAGVVHADRRAPDSVYLFKHALLQDTAYQSLLRGRRRELHVRIAETLESRFPQTARDSPELVAHHWTAAGSAARAVTSWLIAGQRASQRSEYREAIGHLRAGLSLVAQMSDPDKKREAELALLVALAPAIITTQGGGTAEVGALYARSLELCEGTPPSGAHFVAHWGWWRSSMNHRMGRERADKLLALSHDLDEPALLLQAHHCQWATLYMLGAHRECCRHIDEGLRLYEHSRDHVHAALYGGHDARVCALGESALAQWMLGSPGIALERVQAALAWSRELSHVGSRVHAMDYALVLQKFRRDADAVFAQADELVAFAAEQKLRVFRAKGAFFRGWARAIRGNVKRGLREMLEGIASEQAADTPHDFTLYYEMLAEIYGHAGLYDEALNSVADAFDIAERHGIVFWNAELHRRRGELLLARGEREAAEACFEEALACARAQEARSLELRSAASITRLYREQGAADTKVALLSSLCASFSDGFDTPDLVEARELAGVRD